MFLSVATGGDKFVSSVQGVEFRVANNYIFIVEAQVASLGFGRV